MNKDEWHEKHAKYTASDLWKSTRKKVYRRDNWKCRDCGARNCELHAHHTDYRYLGEGSDREIRDCKTLCGRCHDKYDGTVKRKTVLEIKLEARYNLMVQCRKVVLEDAPPDCPRWAIDEKIDALFNLMVTKRGLELP